MRIDRPCKYEAWALRQIWGQQPPTRDVNSLWETRSGTGLFPSIPVQVVNACFTLYRRMLPWPLWLLDCSPFCSSIKVFYRWMFRFSLPVDSSFRCPAWSIFGPAPSWLVDWERPSLFRDFDSVRYTIILFCSTKRGNYFINCDFSTFCSTSSWYFLGGH